MVDVRTDLAGWGILHGAPDLLAALDESLMVDTRALDEAFVQTRQACVGIWQATGSLEDTRDSIRAGWSAPDPVGALTALITAGSNTRAILNRHADQADRTQAILAVCRSTMSAALADTARLLDGLRTDATNVLWLDERADPVFRMFSETAYTQRNRVRQCVADLAAALSADPLEHTTSLMAGHPVFAVPPDRGTPQDKAVHSAQEANMAALDRDLRSRDSNTRATARGIKDALEEAAARGEKATLVLYESAHGSTQARAAVAIGDLASATRTTVTVPGILNTPEDMSGALTDAGNLQRQSEWASDEQTAVVAWFGYTIPGSDALRPPSVWDVLDPVGRVATTLGSVLDAANDDAAVQGGQLLAQDMSTLRGMMPADVVVTGAGFSMGSTTVSQAARTAHVFDEVVLMGSPGAGEGVRTVADYPGMEPSDVWVNSLDDDPVTGAGPDVLGTAFSVLIRDYGNLQPFGADPASATFGAQVLDHRSPADDEGLGLANHTSANYLTGPLLQSMAAVAVGKAGQVPVRRGR